MKQWMSKIMISSSSKTSAEMQRFEALPLARRTLPLRTKASARTTILNRPFVLNVLATNMVCFLHAAVVVFDLLLDRK